MPLFNRTAIVLCTVAAAALLGGCGTNPIAGPAFCGDGGCSEDLQGAFSSLPGLGRIAFVEGAVSGRFHLYHVRPDGKNLVALNDANDPANYLWPSWSPDGGRIAYVTSLGSSAVYRLYLMNSEGKGRRKVLDYAGAIRAPAWSPGGGRMAYQGVDSAANGWDIFVISLDDTTRTNLTRSPGEDQLPSWSPDGSRIAFQSDRHDGTDIYLIDADGSNRVLLVGGDDSRNSAPSWSPAGDRIAFQSTRHLETVPEGVYFDQYEIYTMNAVGGDLRRHTFGSSQFTAAAYPSWSPDGRMIAFEALEVDPSFLTQSHILILDLESGALFQVPDLPPSVRFPRWSPVP